MLALFLALLLAGQLIFPAKAAEDPQHLEGAVVVIHTNDLHGNLASYAKVAAMKKTYEEHGAYVLLLDAGDYSRGQPWVDMSEGESAIALMNMAGYDAAALGAAEFSYGEGQLKKLADQAEFPLLAANVYADGEQIFPAHQIFAAPDGTKIGVFALTSPEVEKSIADGETAVRVEGGQRLVRCAQKQVDMLTEEGCQMIICLGYLGIRNTEGNSSLDILNEVKGIDLFIDGCSHSTLAEIEEANGGSCMVGDTVITSAGSDFREVGIVVYMHDEYAAVTMSAAEVAVVEENVQAKGEELSRAVCGGYGDVTASQWFAPAVRYVTENGLMQGSGGLFLPNQPISRAMLVTVLYRIAGFPEVEGGTVFADVPADSWYAAPVRWAAELGIVKGQTDTVFAPDAPVTREQLATFFYRYVGSPEVSGDLSAYADAAQVSDYAASAMAWAVEAELITGTAVSALTPKGLATRAAAAAVLMRWEAGGQAG